MIAGRGKVIISRLKVFAYHGCTPEEKEHGQTFFIDIELEGDFSAAIEADDLNRTIDYDRVVSGVHEIAAGERYDLIETLAGKIGAYLMQETTASRAVVRVRKPEAPLEFEVKEVAVEMVFEGDA